MKNRCISVAVGMIVCAYFAGASGCQRQVQPSPEVDARWPGPLFQPDLRGPLRLDLLVKKHEYSSGTFAFDLRLRNVSTKPVPVDLWLTRGISVDVEVFTQKGKRLEVHQGPIAQIPYSQEQFQELDAGQEIVSGVNWTGSLREPTPAESPVWIRCSFSNLGIDTFKHGKKLPGWRGEVGSNPIQVQFTSGRCIILFGGTEVAVPQNDNSRSH